MTTDILRRTFAFLVYWLVQALVLNHIHLFGLATPLLYVDFVLTFRRGYPRWAVLLWSFAMGCSVDIFSNTPGVGAGAMTLLGLLQPYLLELFVPRDSTDDMLPTMRTLGTSKFVYYTIACVFVFTLVFFVLEAFSFFNWQQLLSAAGASMVLTVVLVLVVENLRRK